MTARSVMRIVCRRDGHRTVEFGKGAVDGDRVELFDFKPGVDQHYEPTRTDFASDPPEVIQWPHATYTFTCRRCGRPVPITQENLHAALRTWASVGESEFDVSAI